MMETQRGKHTCVNFWHLELWIFLHTLTLSRFFTWWVRFVLFCFLMFLLDMITNVNFTFLLGICVPSLPSPSDFLFVPPHTPLPATGWCLLHSRAPAPWSFCVFLLTCAFGPAWSRSPPSSRLLHTYLSHTCGGPLSPQRREGAGEPRPDPPAWRWRFLHPP